MKKLIAFLVLTAFAIAVESSPRVLTLPSGPHPSAQVVSIDASSGTLTFSYLKANGEKADSGNSIARFTPLAPNNPPDKPVSYPLVPDETLVTAILATQ